MSLADITLDDKYSRREGRVYLTGSQALVRLTLLQAERDWAAGLNTACLVSGYRGSPLGGHAAPSDPDTDRGAALLAPAVKAETPVRAGPDGKAQAKQAAREAKADELINELLMKIRAERAERKLVRGDAKQRK